MRGAELYAPNHPLVLEKGRAVLEADRIRGRWLSGFALDGEAVEVSADAQSQLDAFLACLDVVPPPSDAALAAAGEKQRSAWEAAAQWCNVLPGAPAGPAERYAPVQVPEPATPGPTDEAPPPFPPALPLLERSLPSE